MTNIERSRKTYVIPGVGDANPPSRMFHEKIANVLGGTKDDVHRVEWYNLAKGSIEDRLDVFGQKVSQDLEEGVEVSIVGTSAGGTFGVNALIREPRISRVVAVQSRFTNADFPGFRSFAAIREDTPLVADNVDLFVAAEPNMPDDMRRSVLAVANRYDDIVPFEASYFSGAQLEVPSQQSSGHQDGILNAFYSMYPTKDNIVEFISTGHNPRYER